MATVDASGDPVLITYSVAASNAAQFKSDVALLFGLENPTSVEAANAIARDLRERIRRMRKNTASQDTYDIDPGTVDFT